MRSTFRSLTFGLAATLASASMAQYPYWLTVTGSVSNCYPGQVINLQTVGGTQPAYDFNIPVDANTCTYLTTVGISSTMATWVLSTQCSGQVITYADSTVFNFMGDSAYAVLNFNCGNAPVDCNGVENGPDMPGAPCDDGNPATTGDIWNSACMCMGQDTSYLDCLGLVNGPNLPGTFCINFFGDTGLWSAGCVCQTNSNVYDCMGVLNGQDMPGTACDDGDPMTVQDHWDANCICTGTQANNYDCLGVLGGDAIPGTACEGFNSDSTGFIGTWDYFCVCQPDSNNTQVDCLGNPGGGALPGTPCIIPGTILEGIWSSNCVCEVNNPDPCNADFWVIQAMGSDSLPVPYELWVWNLSSGGSGNFTFTWSFGDGTSSTEAFPTHTYAGNGPYVLCLTIVDNNACTSTHCDSISINGDGIYEGMVVHAEDRQDGFTINVQNPNANAVQELVANNEIALWPNPAVDELNVAVVSGMKGLVTVTITDLDGRTVKTERTTLGGGRSQLRIATSGLNAGMYMLRILPADGKVTDGSVNVSQRFVKTN